VRLAATTALFNALEFAHSNFNNDSERNYLMQASGHLLDIIDVVGARESLGIRSVTLSTSLASCKGCTSASGCSAGHLRGDKQPRCAGPRGIFRVLRQNRQQLLRQAAAIHGGLPGCVPSVTPFTGYFEQTRSWDRRLIHHLFLFPKQDTIFQLTHNAVQKDEEDVAKQAIEFWCSICEEEAAIQEVCRSDLCSLLFSVSSVSAGDAVCRPMLWASPPTRACVLCRTLTTGTRHRCTTASCPRRCSRLLPCSWSSSSSRTCVASALPACCSMQSGNRAYLWTKPGKRWVLDKQ
jgi:hypothetical protein